MLGTLKTNKKLCLIFDIFYELKLELLELQVSSISTYSSTILEPFFDFVSGSRHLVSESGWQATAHIAQLLDCTSKIQQLGNGII